MRLMSPAERPLEPRQGRGRVAIGLPVFNGMPYLPESLSSLRAQDEPDIEIIISDNASDDGTEEYCRSIAAQDPRICYERSATNEGAAANFRTRRVAEHGTVLRLGRARRHVLSGLRLELPWRAGRTS